MTNKEIADGIFAGDYEMSRKEFDETARKRIIKALDAKDAHMSLVSKERDVEIKRARNAEAQVRRMRESLIRISTLRSHDEIDEEVQRALADKAAEAPKCECHLPGFKNHNEKCDSCAGRNVSRKALGQEEPQ